MRRLRAMFEELHEEVRPEYRAAVKDELVRLDATVARSWGDSVDFERARTADTQGIGGPRTRPALDRPTSPSPIPGDADGADSRFDGPR